MAPILVVSLWGVLLGWPLGVRGGEGTLQVPFGAIAKGSRSGVRERQFVVIRTQPQWDTLWRAHQSGVSPEQPLPAFDDRHEMILAVFSGEKNTGGYGIEVARVEEQQTARRLNVVVRETSPAPNAMRVQALTQPYHMVRLKRIDLPVVFSR